MQMPPKQLISDETYSATLFGRVLENTNKTNGLRNRQVVLPPRRFKLNSNVRLFFMQKNKAAKITPTAFLFIRNYYRNMLGSIEIPSPCATPIPNRGSALNQWHNCLLMISSFFGPSIPDIAPTILFTKCCCCSGSIKR